MQGRHCSVRLAEALEEVLPELLEVGESVLPFLPPHCKAALLARAKRQVGLPPRDGSVTTTAIGQPARELIITVCCRIWWTIGPCAC